MPGITAKYTVSQLSEEQKDYLPQFTDTLFPLLARRYLYSYALYVTGISPGPSVGPRV